MGRSAIRFGHVKVAMSNICLRGDLKWEIAYRSVFHGRELGWTYKFACLHHSVGIYSLRVMRDHQRIEYWGHCSI